MPSADWRVLGSDECDERRECRERRERVENRDVHAYLDEAKELVNVVNVLRKYFARGARMLPTQRSRIRRMSWLEHQDDFGAEC